ncbi:MAG TPA: Gmad2 immunoglobulin-like domain-containing protein [Acidimicrobiia bacterium]|nr:Gmad2 immunoglobulin-like domain-containing protein [Acidimicrobiia bacterium]
MAALGAVTGAFGAGCSDDDSEPRAAASSTTTTTAETEPLEPFAGIWPYTTAAEADGYTRGAVDDTFLDPVRTAREFMRVYAGMTDPVAGEFQAGDTQSGEVEIRPRAGSRLVTTVMVRRHSGEGSPWVVVGAAAKNIQVISPVALDNVSSPVAVSGTSSAYEGTVVVQVKEDGMMPGEFLGQEPLIGGAGEELEPFQGQVKFNSPTTPTGAVFFFTESAEDGQVEQVSVVRVRFERAET